MERIKGKDITFILTAGFLMGIVDVLFYTIIDGNPLKSFLILGANCTVPDSTDSKRLRAVVEYAHNWRKTHRE